MKSLTESEIKKFLKAYPVQGSTDRNRSVLGPHRTRTEKIEKSKSDSDQDRVFLKKLGPNRTRTNYFQKISDQLEPGPGKSRTEPDQDHQNLKNLGPSRTRRSVDP